MLLLLLLSPLSAGFNIGVVELLPADRTIFAAAFNQLDNAKPVKGVIAWEFSGFEHALLAYGTLLWLMCRVLHQWEIDVDVS